MDTQRAASLVLAERIWPVHEATRFIRFVVLTMVGAALLTISARVNVPFSPVPMSMQSCAVLFIGAAYGARLGVAAVLLYLVEGALGAPVFAGMGAGLAYMAGPTGGFLIGFVAAAAFAGWLADRGVMLWLPIALLGLLLADAIIFGFGLSWMAQTVGWETALELGLYPFVTGDILKIGLAGALVVAGQALMERTTEEA